MDFRQRADAHQDAAQPSAKLRLKFETPLKVGGIDESTEQEKLADRHAARIQQRRVSDWQMEFDVVHLVNGTDASISAERPPLLNSYHVKGRLATIRRKRRKANISNTWQICPHLPQEFIND